MNPDFFQTPEPITNIGFWKPLIGMFIVLFASFVGVEIRVDNEDDES